MSIYEHFTGNWNQNKRKEEKKNIKIKIKIVNEIGTKANENKCTHDNKQW